MSDYQPRHGRRGSSVGDREEYVPYASYATTSAAPYPQAQYVPTQFPVHSASGYTEGLYSTMPTHYTSFRPTTSAPQPYNQFDSTSFRSPTPKIVQFTTPPTSFSRVSTPDYERESDNEPADPAPRNANGSPIPPPPKGSGAFHATPPQPPPPPPSPETFRIPLKSLKLNDLTSSVSVGYPVPGDKSAACQLCDWHGHTAKTCPLGSDKKDNKQPSCNEAVFTSKEQNEYQDLARKVSHIIQNVVPDSNQPPATNETMIQHIMKCLSSHPGNPEYVHKQLGKEEHQGQWLCIKAMCDNKWEGPVSMATRETDCKYCKKNLSGDPVTLCYQIKPRHGRVALYREVGTLRV
ncbi:hypothetical protein B0H65DRAFT_29457 [Neurospora tetraspora]|uniref:Uncharacterized protein n=1 Tax=Neurospora tetraspora TaxID=94610 RepID=A0AAE0MWK3_9PEZI|nr:hypothetical protein B0H65DRAFT_29457 [Neurospora tetraspora]